VQEEPRLDGVCFGGGSNQGPLEYKSESLTRKLTSLGETGGGSFTGTFERQEKYIWVPFLDPEDIKILNLGDIWNFGEGTGLS
jgi:hypothetical protein